MFLSSCNNPDKLPENTASETITPEAVLQLSGLESQAINLISKMRDEKQANKTAQEMVKKAMMAVLYDPNSAQYSSIKKGQNGAICGKLNAKNRYGAYVGFKDFVVTGSGAAYLSSYDDGLRSDTGSYFARAYLNFCASAAERALVNQITEDVTDDESFPAVDTTPHETPDRVLDAPIHTDESEEEVPTT